MVKENIRNLCPIFRKIKIHLFLGSTFDWLNISTNTKRIFYIFLIQPTRICQNLTCVLIGWIIFFLIYRNLLPNLSSCANCSTDSWSPISPWIFLSKIPELNNSVILFQFSRFRKKIKKAKIDLATKRPKVEIASLSHF